MDYLKINPLLHMDMLESIRCGNAELLEVSEEGVLLYNPACGAYMMSAACPAAADRMIDSFKEPPIIVAHQSFYLDDLETKFGKKPNLICFQAVYLKKEPPPAADAGFVIKKLDESHRGFIMLHYSHADEVEDYLVERLRAGVVYGGYLQGQLVGFIGSHPEGSIGLLEVLPQFQRRGVARVLETFYIKLILQEGRTPFAQIEPGNTASFELHRKLGFGFSAQKIYWLL